MTTKPRGYCRHNGQLSVVARVQNRQFLVLQLPFAMRQGLYIVTSSVFNYILDVTSMFVQS